MEEMSDTRYKLQLRVDNYSTEAAVYQEGTNRINVDIPGVSDAEKILKELGQAGAIYFIYGTGNVEYDYEKAGFPPVSHSETYRAAYHPAYRVVLKTHLPRQVL